MEKGGDLLKELNCVNKQLNMKHILEFIVWG